MSERSVWNVLGEWAPDLTAVGEYIDAAKEDWDQGAKGELSNKTGEFWEKRRKAAEETEVVEEEEAEAKAEAYTKKHKKTTKKNTKRKAAKKADKKANGRTHTSELFPRPAAS